MTSSQWLDIAVLAIAFVAALSGWRSGALGSLLSFVGVALGAMAGVLLAPHLIEHVAGARLKLFAALFLILAMVVIGGRHSLPGVVVGSIALIFIREALADFSIYAQLGYGALVVIIVVFLPSGFAGIPVQVRKSWQRRRGHTLASKSVGPYVPVALTSTGAGDAPAAEVPVARRAAAGAGGAVQAAVAQPGHRAGRVGGRRAVQLPDQRPQKARVRRHGGET